MLKSELLKESGDFWDKLVSHMTPFGFHGVITLCFLILLLMIFEFVNIGTLADMFVILGIMILAAGMGLFLLRLEIYIIHDIFFQKGK